MNCGIHSTTLLLLASAPLSGHQVVVANIAKAS